MGIICPWREEEAASIHREARHLVEQGRVLALPTETFYALAVAPLREPALDRVFALKGRPPDKPLLVLVGVPEMVRQVAREIPKVAKRLMANFWPGPLTLILPARAELPRRVTGGTGAVGVRQPRHGATCRLLTALQRPLTGTSANRSGKAPLTMALQVAREFGDGVDFILDAGPFPGGLPSTIVDVSVSPPRLVRAGAVSTPELLAVLPELFTPDSERS